MCNLTHEVGAACLLFGATRWRRVVGEDAFDEAGLLVRHVNGAKEFLRQNCCKKARCVKFHCGEVRDDGVIMSFMNKHAIIVPWSVAALAASVGFAASVANYVEYIESDGNMTTPGEYVLLDYKPTSASVVEAEVAIRNLTTTHGIFCARGNSTTASTFTLFYIADKGFRWDYNGVNTTQFENIPATDVRHTIRCAPNGFWLDGVKSSTITVAPVNYTPANKMMLFASYTCQPSATPTATGNYAKMRLYSFRAWDDNGATLRVDLYPCVDTDGVAALYDNVTGKIYYNKQSKKAFTAGPSLATSLTVEGSPFAIGETSPAYGVHTNAYLVGATATCTAPATVAENGLSATCTGYELYRDAAGEWALESSGAGNTCSFTASFVDAKLVWLWSIVADLGVGWGGAPSASYNALILPASVSGLGASGRPGTLKAAWGYTADNLVFTNTLATVSELGSTNVTLSVHPNRTYHVRLFLEGAEGDVAETDITAVTTPSLVEPIGLPGLIQAKRSTAWYTDDWDIAGANDADCVLGAWAAHCGNNIAGSMPWTSANGGTSYSTWGNNTTWGYVGFMHFQDATYTFGAMMDDNVRLVINGVTVLDQSGNALGTATWIPPDGEGWYPIEIRVGNGSGNYGPYSGFNGLCWNVTGYTTKDTSLQWNKFVDPGDGSLLRTGISQIEIASIEVAGNALSVVNLSFPSGTASADLHVAWGPENGGNDPGDWAHTEFVAATTGSTTNFAYAVPATWGSPSNLVMRFYLDHGGFSDLSPSIYWQDLSVPAVSATKADGAGGDTLVVTGTIDSFPGDSCTLTVYTGDSPATMTNAWTGLAGSTLTAAGDFSLTLFEPDTTSPRYLAPGTTVYAIVRATSNGRAGTGPTVVTPLSAEPAIASVTPTVTRRMVVYQVKLSEVGANAPAYASLWVGEEDDESSLAQVGDPVAIDLASWPYSMTNTFDVFEKTYYAQIRVTNTTAGATAGFEVRSALVPALTRDATTYTWKNEVFEGDWSDAANWDNNQANDCLGYPQSTAATAAFPAQNASTVRLTEPLSIHALNLSADNLWTTFAYDGASSDDARLTVSTAINFNGTGGHVTISNATIHGTSSTTTYGARPVTIRDGASLLTGNIIHRNGGTIRVENGGYYRPWEVQIGAGSSIVISNGTLNVGSQMYLGHTTAGGSIRLEGTHPVLLHNNIDASFRSSLANAGTTLDFLVPAGGYEEPPVRCQSAQKYLLGNNGGNAGSSVLQVRVLAESPAVRDGATITTPLVSWHKGVNTARVSATSLLDVPSTMLYGTSATDDYGFADAAGFSGTPYSIGVRIEGNDHGDRLTISSTPLDVAAAGFSPAFGDHDGYANGDTVTCTAPSGVVQISEALRGSVTGGTIYRVDAQSGRRTAVETFTGTSYTYTADGFWHEIEWAWDLECLVTTVSGGNGSVAGAVSDWLAYGSSATVSATAAAGYAFAKWEGDLLSENVIFDNPCTFTVTGPMTNTATFWGVVYVSPKGSDSNGGTSWADAKKTISAAVASRDNPYVLVSNGLYAVTTAINLTKAAIVSGLDDDCGAVVYLSSKPSVNSDATCCAFYLAHAGAVLRRIAVAGRTTGLAAGYGRGIYINGGGLVDHCVVTNNHAWKDGAYGAGVWINNVGTLRDSLIAGNVSQKKSCGGGVYVNGKGVVERCVITNNTNLSTGFGYTGGGAALYAPGGVIRDSLIAGNTAYGEAGGLGMRDALVENCTIAGNSSLSDGAGGLFLSTTATIRNSVVWGNASGSGNADWTIYGIHTTAERCTSPVALPGDGNLAVDPGFANAAAGDYRPGLGVCVDAGVVTDGMDGRLDLDGKARVLGSAPDLGCYERTPASGLECGIVISSDDGGGTAACSFEASVAGDNLTGLVYTWRVTGSLGYDQTCSGPDLATLSLDLPAGIFSVSLAVTNSLGAGATAVREDVLTILASDTYVSLDGGHVFPFDSWAHASTNIAVAADATGEGGTVHVADGFYTMPEPLAVTRGIRIASANGPDRTTIFAMASTTDGFYHPVLRIAHADAVVSGITISGIASDGVTRPAQHGGVQIDAVGGMLTNCIVSGHYRTTRQISPFYGTLNGTGGRAFGGIIVDCVFHGNYNSGAESGAGLYKTAGLVERCVFTNNTIATETTDNSNGFGGGVNNNGGTIRNCLIAHNFSNYRGGGISVAKGLMENCTVVDNRIGPFASAERSGASLGTEMTVVDNIICLNRTTGGAYDDENDPGFADAANGDYHLVAGSSAIDAATRTPGEGERDLDGSPRVLGPAADLGCYEFDPSQFSFGITYAFETEGPGVADVRFMASAPAGFALDDAQTWWTFDGSEPSASNHGASGTNVVVTLQPGVQTVRARTVFNGATYASDRIDWFCVFPATVHVVATPAEAPASAAPYATWETAATNLAEALTWATDGTTVLLGDGIHVLTNTPQQIARAVTVTSVNGPGATAVSGNRKYRPFWIANDEAILSGITVTDGLSPGKNLSGGIFLQSGTVSNCVVVKCTANNTYPAALYMSGGLFVDSTVTNCSVSATSETWGSAIRCDAGLIDRCRIVGNVSSGTGSYCGGINIAGGTVRNTLIAGNSAAAFGGVRMETGAVLENCTVVGNVTQKGYKGSNYNAGINTVNENTVVNCISWGNVTCGDVSERMANVNGAEENFSNCAFPANFGANCVTNPPRFLGRPGREYDLQSSSPCRNAGALRDWMDSGALDLLHRPRLSNRRPDIGAFEVQSSPMMLFVQ